MPASRPQKITDSTLEDRNTHQQQLSQPNGAPNRPSKNNSLSASNDQQSKKYEPVDPKHSQVQQQQQHNGGSTTTTSHSDSRRHFHDEEKHHDHAHHSNRAQYTITEEEEERQRQYLSSVPPNTSSSHHPPFSSSTTAAGTTGASSLPAGDQGRGGGSPRSSTDSRRSSVVGARSFAQPSQSPRSLTPSPTMMPQRHLGLLLRQGQGQGLGAMVGHALASGARSIVGSVVGSSNERSYGNGGGSTASGHGTPASISSSVFTSQHHTSGIMGGVAATGRSPILTSEDSAEQTLLLVRPTWVQDQAVNECAICERTFSAVRRKHHCRQCGRVVCHDNSSRSLVLPQLGYTKAVRVCDDCFDVAYLVAYILSDDLGPTTQIHGARGLYDIVEGNDERAIQSVLDHGGLDAMIFLCRMSHSYELHALATSFMATLTDKGEQMKLLIVSKRAMSNLYHLVTFYGLVQQQQQRKPSSSNVSPTRSPLPATAYAINPTPMPLTRMGSVESIHTRTTKRIETITLIMMNVTHVIFRMVSSSKDLSRQLARDGGLDCLMTLSVYFPAGVRTRAMEEALKTMAQRSPRPEPSVPRRPLSAMSTLSNSDHELQSDRSSISGRANSLELAEVPGGGCAVDEDDEENTLIHMDEWFHERVEVMQQRAAKSISIMASDPVNQAYMVEDPERVDRMVQLLYSTNPDVVKYAAKTTAFLSLRNDKHKTSLVRGAGVAALLMVIRLAREQHFSSLAEHEGQEQLLEAPATNDGTRRSSSSPSLTSNTIVSTKLSSEAVSHACCTLANLATSIESQDILMSYTDLIELTCGVVGLYPSQTEVERHVSRLLANLALYDQNKLCLLTDHSSMPHDQSHAAPITNPYRYSSPPPPPHRAKGNVIPTLMFIGAMTLELPSYSSGFQDSSDPYYVHHPVAVFPDTSELVALLQEPFEIPELPSKESNGDDEQIEQQHAYQLYPHHHQSHTYGTSPASARHGISSSPSHANMSGLTALTAATIDLPMISATAWRTVPGTDDIQRHFIRAIDNLLTSTPVVGVDSPEAITEETFKVFLKLWPTISLILAIRAATRDEDTQRRATHVLSTLKQQRTCHQSFIDRFVEEHSHHPSQQQYQKEEEEKSPEVHHRQDTAREHVSQERLQEQHEEQEEAKRKKQREEDERWEKERAEAERIEEERRQQMEDEERRRRLEQEENERRAEEERREKERLQHEAEERARLQKEQEEQEKEQKRLEKERLEQEAKEKAKEEARLRKEREEAEEAERRRLKQQEEEEKQKAEEVRKQKEKEEAEEAERRRLKQEEEEKKQKAEEARKKKEKEEAEEAERRRLKQEEEEKKAEEARKKKEKEEAEEAERRRLKQEEERKLKEKEEAEEAERRRKKEKKQKEKEEEAILRLEEQEGELERNRGEREKLKMKKVEDRIQQLMERKDREAVDSSTDEISSATEDEVPARSAAAAKKSSSSSSKDKKKKKKKSK